MQTEIVSGALIPSAFGCHPSHRKGLMDRTPLEKHLIHRYRGPPSPAGEGLKLQNLWKRVVEGADPYRLGGVVSADPILVSRCDRRPYRLGGIVSADPIPLRRGRWGLSWTPPPTSVQYCFKKCVYNLTHTNRLMRRWGCIGGNPFPYVV